MHPHQLAVCGLEQPLSEEQPVSGGERRGQQKKRARARQPLPRRVVAPWRRLGLEVVAWRGLYTQPAVQRELLIAAKYRRTPRPISELLVATT